MEASESAIAIFVFTCTLRLLCMCLFICYWLRSFVFFCQSSACLPDLTDLSEAAVCFVNRFLESTHTQIGTIRTSDATLTPGVLRQQKESFVFLWLLFGVQVVWTHSHTDSDTLIIKWGSFSDLWFWVRINPRGTIKTKLDWQQLLLDLSVLGGFIYLFWCSWPPKSENRKTRIGALVWPGYRQHPS